MIDFLIIFLIFILSTLFFTIGQAVVLIVYGIPIKSIQFGYGKTLKTINLKSFDLKIGWIPGSSIDMDIDLFNLRSLLVRWVIILSGPFAMFLSSAIFLTFASTASEFIRGYSQFFGIIFHPTSYGQSLIKGLLDYIHNNSFLNTYGIVTAKITTFNMLPVPVMAGGRLFMEIFPLTIKTKMIIQNIFLILMLMAMLSIGYAFIIYIF